jgi:hypothetical protein
MMRIWCTALVAFVFLWFQPNARAAAGEALVQAKQLYESASYEQALDVLDRLEPADTSTMQDLQSARRYRVLCLVALDRNADAERVLEELIRAEPTTPVTGDLSPRVEALVQRVRQRVARAVVKENYEQGRNAYDRRQYAEAADRLSTVIRMVDDPTLGLKADPSLADLRVLADGFLTLAQASIPAAASAVRPAASAKSTPSPDSPGARRPLPAPAAAPSPSDSSAAAGAVASGRQQVSTTASGFVLPKAIARPIPRFDRASAGYTTRREGELEIEIGADGSVLSAEVKVATNPTYDALLVATVKQSWKYEPATRLGVPVPYRLRVKFVLANP